MLTFINTVIAPAYAGNMGWVYEENELRASYPDKTWWMVGDRVRLSTYITNMDDRRTMESAYADVFLVSPSGERINVTRIRVREVYPLRAGEMRSFEVQWDSTGHEPGYYRLEMIGAADFEYGEDKELSNYMDGAVKLFSWDHPVFRPRVVDVELPKTGFVQGEPFTCEVTVENEGNVPAFPVISMALREDNNTVWRPQMMDEPGVIYKEGERYTSHFKTWLPEDLPPGTYSCEVNVMCFAAWPSTDGSGWTPWPSGDAAYGAPWPEYTGECYYPYPMEDGSLGYPIILGNATYYMPWPTVGYDGIWPWPDDVSFSPPGGDPPCSEAAQCGEGVFGWSDFLCEYSYGPSTCQSVDCGEIEVEEPFYSFEIVDYAFTELPVPIGEESIILAEVSNEGNTPIDMDWYVFTLEDESHVTVEAIPDRLQAGCDTVIELYVEFDDFEPGDYTLEIEVEGLPTWPEDVGEWVQTEYIIPNMGYLLNEAGATHSLPWLDYASLAEEYDLWPTYRAPGQTGGDTQGPPPELNTIDSFFDVFYEIDFSDTPLITGSLDPMLVGLEEPDSEEPETPSEGEPVFSDWMIGDTITVTTTIYNTGDLPIVSELGTVFVTMPTGVTFDIGNIDDSAVIEPGGYKEYPFSWHSEGAPAGMYGMSLGGAVGFSDGSGQMLYNFEPNAWVLVDPNAPRLEPTVYDVSLEQVTPSTLMGGVTVFNDGTVPFFPIFHFGLVGEDGSLYPMPVWDLPGTLFMPGQAYYYPYITWIPEDVPSGTYGWSMQMECVTAWPSVDGSGHLPWYPGSGEAPSDPTGYYPFPTTDPELGYPVEGEDDTDFYEFTVDQPYDVTIWTSFNEEMDTASVESDLGWVWYVEDVSEGTHTLYLEVSDDLYDTEDIEVVRGLFTLEITVEEMPDSLLYGDNLITVELENDCPEVYLTEWTLDLWNEDGDEYTCPCDVPNPICSPGVNSYDLTCEIPDSIPPGEYCGELTAECEVARQMAIDDILGGQASSRPLGALDTYMNDVTLGIAPTDTSSWTSSAQSKPTWDSYMATYTEEMEDGTGTRKPTNLDSEGEGTISKYYLENCPYEVGRGESETSVDVSGDDPEDDWSPIDIPGFPYESVLVGLILVALTLPLMSRRRG